MKYSESVKPISYLKAHASELIRDITSNNKTMLITHNGEAKVIVQDVKVYEKTQESLALLKILALSAEQIKKGKVRLADAAFTRLYDRVSEFKLQSREI
jgi:PHD/YefM family antitoxin component YafN of YafNO toxin-antitoxin module